MRVCVVGLWHLGTVTAACLAQAGHEVTGLEFDGDVVRRLQAGQPPVFEPGLEQLVQAGVESGALRFTTDAALALVGAEVVWITYDTPVDEDDRADVESVLEHVRRLFPALPPGTLVLLSSQLPVGSTAGLERDYAAAVTGGDARFAYSPENLRLGKAILTFTQPDRVVVGMRNPDDGARVAALLAPFGARLEWMSVESAEMTKHALNAFLATSVTFINELAGLCERVGADAKDVERGLKTESRIGPRAYLGPGSAFAGGTLARDVTFLAAAGDAYELPMHLVRAVKASNDAHKAWTRRTLREFLGDLHTRTVAVWGLTYKPGTDTLRRSSAIELCQWLAEEGARVQAHDPAVKALPPDLAGRVTLRGTPRDAADGASALVVATEWPDYAALEVEEIIAAMAAPLVIDPNRFLANTLGADRRVRYAAVGSPS